MTRTLTGIVTSDVQDKTIVVSVARRVMHPIYGKQYTVTKKYAAHDEANEARVGDKVEIVESRPISRRKTWRLSQIVVASIASREAKGEEASV